MKKKPTIEERLLGDAMRAYDEENKAKLALEERVEYWHDRAIKAEFVVKVAPAMVLLVIVALALTAYLWAL